ALAGILGTRNPAPAAAPERSRGALRWKRSLVAAAFVATVAAFALLLRWAAAPSAPQAPSQTIAVLPCRKIGAEAGCTYYTERLSEDITAQLARMAAVRVVSGISVRRYQNTDHTASEIGRELNVRRLVTGSVRISGEKVRVVAELVDCATSEQVWAGT